MTIDPYKCLIPLAASDSEYVSFFKDVNAKDILGADIFKPTKENKISVHILKEINEKIEAGYDIGIVGGGTFEKATSQLGPLKIMHYFTECGCVYHHRDSYDKISNVYKKNIREHPLYSKINILVKEALKLSDEIKVIERYNPINPINSNGIMKLPESVVKSFRSSTFAKVVTTKTTKLYRVVNGDFDVTKAAESGGLLNLGSYWSRTPPLGPVQATLDAAIDQSFGNNALKVIEIEVPANFEFFEGIAGEINSLSLEATNAVGNLLGGGTQVYIPDFKVPSSWIKKVGEFK